MELFQWLLLFYSLTIGTYEASMSDSHDYGSFNVHYMDVGMEIEALGVGYVGGSVKTDFTKPDGCTDYTFQPIEAYYLAYGGLRYKYFDFRIEHQCDHGIESFGLENPHKRFGEYTSISLTISNKYGAAK